MDSGSFQASRYAPERLRTHHLSVLCAQGVSAWAVHDLDRGEVIALGWGPEQQALMDPMLPKHPASVSFISLPEWSTLVPEGALAPGTEAAHLALVHGGRPSGAMRDEPVRSLGATCIYVHDDVAERAVLERFPNARALPMQGLMIHSVLGRAHERPTVLLHRSADRLDVAIASKGTVLMSNTFPARTAQDLLYFALLAVEQTGLHTHDALVLVSGTHLVEGERNLLQRYFTDLAPAMRPLDPGLDTGTDFAADRWLALLEQFACVS